MRLFCESGIWARALETASFLEGGSKDGGWFEGGSLGGCCAELSRGGGGCRRIGEGLLMLPRGPGGVCRVAKARTYCRGSRNDQRAAGTMLNTQSYKINAAVISMRSCLFNITLPGMLLLGRPCGIFVWREEKKFDDF